MQCFMSKKIALPKNVSLRAIAWNKTHGYIACGGNVGVLKVLKMESRKESVNTASASASSSLSTNQSLEGHAGAVSLIQWNEPYQKLTSCDKNGFIMVWMEHKGIWYEEMVNNRQKSLVKGMAWNHDGQKICIAYDDGVIIVGSVDGNRIWGKELKGLNLTCVEWSPDGRLLLLGSSNGEVHIYEFGGAFVGLVPMSSVIETKTGSDLFMISWYKNQKDVNIPSLVIAFESGVLQLMKNENDSDPITVDTRFIITTMEWNPDGSVLAVAGKRTHPVAPDKSHEVLFFSPHGQVLYILRFAGNIAGLSWEGNGQRIALAVDSFIFFASIRPFYKWCYFSNTLAYAYCKSIDKKESTIMFWNTNTKEKHIKLVKNLLSMTAFGDFCCLASKLDDNQFSLVVCNAIGSPVDSCTTPHEPKFIAMNYTDVYSASGKCFCKFHFCSPKSKTLLQLTNEVSESSEDRCLEFPYQHVGEYGGKELDRVSFRPICCIAVSDTVLVLCDIVGRFYLYTLPQVNLYHVFQNLQSGITSKISLNSLSNVMASINIYGEIAFHNVLDFWTFFKTHQDSSHPEIEVEAMSYETSMFRTSKTVTTSSEKNNESSSYLHSRKFPSTEGDSEESFLGPHLKKIGSIHSPNTRTSSDPPNTEDRGFKKNQMFMPSVGRVPEDEQLSSEVGQQKPVLYVNEAIPDRLYDNSDESLMNIYPYKQKPLEFDRKCAWDIKWAADDGQMCAIMDKMRMYIYRGTEPEEPMACLGYMCEFKDLEVKAVLLMDLMQNPEDPNDEYFIQNEVKSLRDTRNLIEKVGIKDATQFIEENSHPRLWRLLAEAAMRRMDFGTAESAFVRCKDYQGIQFVKNVLEIQNETTRKAEVAAYFKNLEEADKIYLDNDELISAIHLHRLLGDWFKVFELLKSNDLEIKEMEEAWNGLGDYFFDRQRWSEAITFYEKAHNEDRFAECCYMLEDYSKLEKLLNDLPESHKLLPELGSMFASVGMCEQASTAYIKSNRINMAIDCCTTLNQWQMAISLAQKYDIKDVNSLLLQYAVNLKQDKSIFTVVELYKKACKFLDAALILYKCVKDLPAKLNDPFFLRKVYVLVGILITEYRANRKCSNLDEINLYDLGNPHDSTHEAELSFQNLAPKLMSDPWRGAKAYHFLLLSQKHLYQGYMDAAMKTALHLREYEDILDLEDIYSLLALSSCANRAFATCSSAFMKLESLEILPEEKKLKYKNLAAEIFTKHPPKDSRITTVHCKGCTDTIPDWYTTCPSCSMTFPVCIASGRPIINPLQRWTCLQCHHSAFKQEMLTRSACPLCHFPSVPV